MEVLEGGCIEDIQEVLSSVQDWTGMMENVPVYLFQLPLGLLGVVLPGGGGGDPPADDVGEEVQLPREAEQLNVSESLE